eukprot:TRINITY_DN20939_c0_g1_i1.p2 TRINITY_DN20939_c0_g1~~TRINITY_DN20939_c0_g1_i1.p2  ORF type:complete len:170 (+),score=68.28 TRINITY_DN20939_c0_g1_i1:43-552(+)
MAAAKPPCSWAQRKDKVFVTVDLLDFNGDVTFAEDKIHISGTGKKMGADVQEWELSLDLVGKLDPAECVWKQTDRCVEILGVKKEKGQEYWEKLVAQPNKLTKAWLTTNWAMYIEEEDETEEANKKLEGFGGYGDKSRLLTGANADSDDEIEGVDARPADVSDILTYNK